MPESYTIYGLRYYGRSRLFNVSNTEQGVQAIRLERGSIVYVGFTAIPLRERLDAHKCGTRGYIGQVMPFIRDAITIEILEDNIGSKIEARRAEERWIQSCGTHVATNKRGLNTLESSLGPAVGEVPINLMPTVTGNVPQWLHDAISRIAAERNTTVNKIVRRALEDSFSFYRP